MQALSVPLFILGATAVGKSELAMQVAERLGASILVMDAMQVYRGLEIGVGKPTGEELRRVPHGGINLVPWTEQYDVARYVSEAMSFLTNSTRPVIVCGGTGLYFQALTKGLCEVPPAPTELREALSKLRLIDLQERLLKVDPAMRGRLDMNNPRRVQRAIECMESTGRSLYDWQQQTPVPPLTDFRAVWLQRPMQIIRQRISSRIQQMIKFGWLDEVRGLILESEAERLARCPAIGYRELAEVCLDQMGLSEAEKLITLKTVHYAKRQVTWFNKATNVFPMTATDSSTELCEKVISNFLHGT